ncbi:MAG: NUDIX domain-containing protein [Candidatus Kerfeldbacteria bacterium]|nr:NUDIX domain-containing protein [Candidatus Kerfeldbacteria bacterium]
MYRKPKAGIDYVGVSIVFFCHDGQGRVLMAKRSENARDEHGKWDIGAGKVEVGDSVEETLHKEIQEEYSTEVISYEFLGFRDVHRMQNEVHTHWITLDFKVLVRPENVAIGEPAKFSDIGWFNKNQIPSNEQLHSQLPFFFQKYSEQL